MAENEENKSEEKEEPQKKKLPVKIIVLSTLFLFLFGGGLFAWKGGFLAKLLPKENKQAVGGENSDGATKQDIGPIYPLDIFIVNLMEADGKRYLKLKLDLELNNEEVKLEVEKRLPQIRDSILTLLSGKSFDDIHTLEGKFLLRTEVISMLNQHLKTGKITNVYFTEFIVQ